MANTTISPNMNMPVPVVGVDLGPDWATNYDSCLSVVDSHNHTAGQGVAITPAAININADFPMNNNNLITARSVRFFPQVTTIADPADLGCLYEQGVDLYYIDGSGNNIRLTQSGAPAGATGTITGLPSGTASASFSGSTFTFESATNTPATMNVGPVIIGQPVASGFGVTISPSVSQAVNYSLTLPLALPTVASVIVSDSSGNLSFSESTSSVSFTPTVTPVQFISVISNIKPMIYSQVGKVVTCYGALDVDISGTGLNGIFRMTLPVTPNFATSDNASGFGAAITGAGNIPEILQIYAIASGTQVECLFIGTTIGNSTFNYSFSYRAA